MQIGWIDYSKEERDKILSIFTLLSGQDTLDQLGIGSVRDAFSDMLFPGISTQQRRAKYFVLLPYMFYDALQEVQADKLHSGKAVRDFFNERENKIVNVLINHSKPNAQGIVGRRNLIVDVKPSAMYWSGLKTLGILTEPSFSIDNACNAIYGKGKLHSKTEMKNETKDSGADDPDIYSDGYVIFDSIKYKYPYMKEASIDLTFDEADFLFKKILHAEGTKDSALAYLLRNPNLIQKYTKFEDFDYRDFSGELAEKVRLAREFSDFIYGAHLLYNIVYAEGCGTETDIVSRIKKEFYHYCDNYKSPNIEEIIIRTKPNEKTREFIRLFDSDMTSGNIEKAKQDIVEREQKVKLNLSKLQRPTEHQFSQPIHYFKLSYRYDHAREIMMDIISGLGAKK